MTIKVYDKFLELVGRDGTQMVGSRIRKVIGAQEEPDALLSKIRNTQTSGMTRLEISYRFSKNTNQTFGLPCMISSFYSKAKVLLNEIVSHVLNDLEVLKNVYKRINIQRLTNVLSNLNYKSIPHNFLVIGQTTVWLIVASTCHKKHFVGTVRKIMLKPNLRNELSLTRLHEFIKTTFCSYEKAQRCNLNTAINFCLTILQVKKNTVSLTIR